MASEIGAEEKDILERFAKAVKARYIKRLSETVSATKLSERSIGYQITQNGLQMIAGAWFPAIDYGRGRSRAKQDTGFYRALENWIIKKDAFVLSTSVSLHGVVRSLQWKINKYGTKGNATLRDRKILSGVDTSDLERTLVEELGRKWATDIVTAVVYESRFQFIDVKLNKR